jgi:replicative DNA helicase
VKQRACSILSGQKLSLIEGQLNEEAWEQHYAGQLQKADHVDWSYQNDIDPEYIALRIKAHAELRGEYPQLIVVDNLGNAVVDQDNEASELRAICRELQGIARTCKAHVMALHHVKGAKENGDKPITLGDLLYNIGKIPEMVLGLHRENGALAVTVPKNRGGKAGLHVPVSIDYETATVGGFL